MRLSRSFTHRLVVGRRTSETRRGTDRPTDAEELLVGQQRRTVLVVSLSLMVFVPVALPGPTVATPAVAEAVSTDTADDVWVDGSPDTLEGTVIVRFDPHAPPANADREATISALETRANRTQAAVVDWAAETDGVEIRSRFWLVNAVTLSVDDDADIAPLGRFATVDAVYDSFRLRRHEPVSGGHAATREAENRDPAEPSDPDEVTDGLEQIGVPAARERYDATGEGATVAVLDTGVEAGHPDLTVDQFQEFDAAGRAIDTPPNDPSPNNHGTHTAGTVAGGAESGTAIGVAPGADLAVGAVLTECRLGGCGGTFEQIIAGMEWAVADAEADVMSMSLGVGGRADRMVEPVRNARAAGTVVVAAAGNSGAGTSGSPGNVYETVAVGAVDETGAVAEFSGGERVARDSWSEPPTTWPDEWVVPTVSAPGVDVYSADGEAGYDRKTGTSMAAPHVAGVAALVVAERDVEPSAVETALESTAAVPDDAAGSSERDTRYGAGIVDAEAAVESVAEEPPPIPAVERVEAALPGWLRPTPGLPTEPTAPTEHPSVVELVLSRPGRGLGASA